MCVCVCVGIRSVYLGDRDIMEGNRGDRAYCLSRNLILIAGPTPIPWFRFCLCLWITLSLCSTSVQRLGLILSFFPHFCCVGGIPPSRKNFAANAGVYHSSMFVAPAAAVAHLLCDSDKCHAKVSAAVKRHVFGLFHFPAWSSYPGCFSAQSFVSCSHFSFESLLPVDRATKGPCEGWLSSSTCRTSGCTGKKELQSLRRNLLHAALNIKIKIFL